MKKILIVLCLSLFSCVKQPDVVNCTQDSQFYYEKTKVESLKMVGTHPPIYEIKYKDGTTELFYGSCFMPNSNSGSWYY